MKTKRAFIVHPNPAGLTGRLLRLMISALTVIITTVAVIAAASVRLLRQDGDVAGDVSFESGGTLAVHFDDVPARKQQGKRSHGE